MLRTTLTTIVLPFLLAACSGGGGANPDLGGGGSGGGNGGGNGGGQPDPGYFLKVYPPSTEYDIGLGQRLWKRFRLSQPDADSMRVDYLGLRSMRTETNTSITPYVLSLKGETLSQNAPFSVTKPDEIPQGWFDDGRMAYARVENGRYFSSAGEQPYTSASSFTLTGRETLTGMANPQIKFHSYSVETLVPFGVVYGEGSMRLSDGSFLAAYASNERAKTSDTNIDRMIFEWVEPGLTKTSRARTVVNTSGFQQGSDMSFLELPDGSVVVSRTLRTNRSFRGPLGTTMYYFDAHVFRISDAASGRKLLWNKTLPSIHYYDTVTSLRLAPDGDIMLAYGGSKLVANALATRIVKMNAAGTILATNQLQVSEEHVIFDFLPLANGDILLVGGMRSATHNNEESLFLGHLDKNLTVPDPSQN